MREHYTLYGWHLSYFTGKALCYLRYKQVDFHLEPVNMYTLMKTIKQRTGAAVMPVLKTAQGEWIQDTSVIIDRIEALYPAHPVVPESPVLKFACAMLEAWGDEWWVPIAMHTRWNYPENYALFEHDAGKALLPWAPAFVQKKAAAKPAKMLRSMLPAVGIVPDQYETMNQWTVQMLDALDAHFSQHRFMLGDRPCLADFGLVGTMYGHLGRDPWPKRELVDPRTHLKAWLDRMTHPAAYAQGALCTDDTLPKTLAPVLHSVFHEFVPLVRDIAQQAIAMATGWGLNRRLPRVIGRAKTTMGGKPFERGSLPYMIWMLQRALDVYSAMDTEAQAKVRAWLKDMDALDLLDIELPRVERDAVYVKITGLPTPSQPAESEQAA